MYHDLYIQSGAESGFQNESAFQYKIQVDEFEKQVKAVVDYCREHIEIQVDFTFDDGGVSFLTLAAPILEKYGLKGIFFYQYRIYKYTSFSIISPTAGTIRQGTSYRVTCSLS